MCQRDLDGMVLTSANNVFYTSGFNGIAHKSDEPRPYAVVISREAPEDAIIMVADYYVSTLIARPSWIQDVRSFRAVMLPLDLPPSETDIERFIPQTGLACPWIEGLKANYGDGLGSVCRKALQDLKLNRGRIAFDDLRLGASLGIEGMVVADAYDPMMYARSVKTSSEFVRLKAAAAVNEIAIMGAIAAWDRGMSWREFNHAYHVAAVSAGGFVRDPGAMVWGHPRGVDPAITLQSGVEDFEVTPGMHVLFDCHGTADMYCWDGGKTWVVDGEPAGVAAGVAKAIAEVAAAVCDAMRPGVRISELQAKGRDVFRRCGVPDADSALIFFHGLGLSHMDLEQVTADGQPNIDWQLEAGMVVPLHILYPGGENERFWLEEVVEVTAGGGKPYFSWGFDPITGRG